MKTFIEKKKRVKPSMYIIEISGRSLNKSSHL